jgi:hypothetical protein
MIVNERSYGFRLFTAHVNTVTLDHSFTPLQNRILLTHNEAADRNHAMRNTGDRYLPVDMDGSRK